MPATKATPVQKFAAIMPMAGFLMEQGGLPPRDALRRAFATFAELPADVVARASKAIVSGDWAGWCKALPAKAVSYTHLTLPTKA